MYAIILSPKTDTSNLFVCLSLEKERDKMLGDDINSSTKVPFQFITLSNANCNADMATTQNSIIHLENLKSAIFF